LIDLLNLNRLIRTINTIIQIIYLEDNIAGFQNSFSYLHYFSPYHINSCYNLLCSIDNDLQHLIRNKESGYFKSLDYFSLNNRPFYYCFIHF
jgi:hypothetical protein